MIGNFACSKAGHDKSRIYVITAHNDRYVWLSDGKYRTLANPKRKCIRHIQIISRTVDKELLERFINKETIFDEQVKYAIKQYINQKVD